MNWNTQSVLHLTGCSSLWKIAYFLHRFEVNNIRKALTSPPLQIGAVIDADTAPYFIREDEEYELMFSLQS